MSIESVMSFTHLILCSSLLLSIFPSIRFFSNESFFRIRWPKYWSFGFSISPSNERPGLVSFRVDCLDLLAVQGTLKSLLQSSGNAIAPFWRKHVWAGLFWKLNSVLRAQLERQADTCTQVQFHRVPATVALVSAPQPPSLLCAQPLSLSGAARHRPTAAFRDLWARSDHPTHQLCLASCSGPSHFALTQMTT